MKRLIALKFEAQLVKLVQVRQEAGRLLLERAAQASTVALLIGASKPDATRCIAALPREDAFSRMLTLPTADEGELRPMVELQAKGLLPYSQTDLVFDFLTLRRTSTHTTVLLLGVTRPVVERYLAMLQQAGLTQPHVTLTTSGLLHWYRAMRSRLPTTGTIILLELDTAVAECLVVSDSALRLTRSLPLGTSQVWFEELDRTLESYRKEYAQELPTAVVLTGDPTLVRATQAPLQEWIRLPVHAVDQWQAVTAAPGVTLPDSGAWSATVGLALAPGGHPLINLLPAEARRKRLRRAQQRAWLTTAVLTIAVLYAAAGFFLADLRQQRQVAAQLEAALQTLAPQAKQLARDVQRVGRLQDLVKQQGTALVVLQELYRATPADILLTQLLLEPSREVRIRGTGPTLGSILGYVGALEDSARLTDVHVRYSTERATKAGLQVEFEIVCRVQ